jgi:hypothetical protein
LSRNVDGLGEGRNGEWKNHKMLFVRAWWNSIADEGGQLDADCPTVWMENAAMLWTKAVSPGHFA